MRLLLPLLLILCMALPANAEQALSFGYIGAPLSYSSLEVLKVAYAKMGIHVDGEQLPAARSLIQSDAGLTDGEVHRIEAIAPHHPQLIRIEVPINVVEGLALSCGKSIDTTNLKTFSNYRIGIKVGTRYAERLTADMPNITSRVDEKNLMKMLLADRLDVVIGDRPWAEVQVALPGGQCIQINEPPLVVIPLYHYLHIRHGELAPKITGVLTEMKHSGEMDSIIKKSLASIRNSPPQ